MQLIHKYVEVINQPYLVDECSILPNKNKVGCGAIAAITQSWCHLMN